MIITLTGLKQSGKTKLARIWGKNVNVSYLCPYTTNKNRPTEFFYMERDRLKELMESEDVLCSTVISGELYVYFEHQLKNDFNIMILDDYAVSEVVENYNGRIVKVWVDNPKGESSDRTGHFHSRDYYDYIYNVGLDDPDEFLEQLAFDVEMVQQ